MKRAYKLLFVSSINCIIAMPRLISTSCTVLDANTMIALSPNTRLLTFDRDLPKRATRNAPGVLIHLL